MSESRAVIYAVYRENAFRGVCNPVRKLARDVMIPYLVTFIHRVGTDGARTERRFVVFFPFPPRWGRSRGDVGVTVTSGSSVDRRADQWNRRGANPTPTPSFAARGHRPRATPKKERHPSGESLTGARTRDEMGGGSQRGDSSGGAVMPGVVMMTELQVRARSSGPRSPSPAASPCPTRARLPP